ncbi:MAG: hypothetical protein R3B90_22900 [Planctomycetaceae bacterium]
MPLTLADALRQREGREYVCPGETAAISREVHLSRMAAFYPTCQRCPHNLDRGTLPVTLIDDSVNSVQPRPATELFEQRGLRGVYLNEITREVAESLACSLGSLLWDGVTRRGRSVDDDRADDSPSLQAPRVVVSRDARPLSTDILVGVVRGLRRMGCEVIDIGDAPRPVLDFAVYYLRTTAGVHITGAPKGSAWTGIDVVGMDGVPWSLTQLPADEVAGDGAHVRPASPADQHLPDGQLAAWRRRHIEPQSRPSRHAGTLEFQEIANAHAAELQRTLHGLPECKVGLINVPVSSQRRLDRLFADRRGGLVRIEGVTLPLGGQTRADVPLQFDAHEASGGQFDPPGMRSASTGACGRGHQPLQIDVTAGVRRQIRTELQTAGAPFAIAVGSDGQQLHLFDERGQLVPPNAWLVRLSDFLARRLGTHPIIVGRSVPSVIRGRLTAHGIEVVTTADSDELLVRTMLERGGLLATDGSGRVWLNDHYPCCDPLVLLTWLIRCHLAAPRPLSQWKM